MCLDKLPQITILYNTISDGEVYYFSLNNRRLWVLKELHARGYFGGKLLDVRLKEALPRERERYTIERCSLTARIMKEGPSNGFDNEGPDEADSMQESVGQRDDSKVAGGIRSVPTAISVSSGDGDTCAAISSETERAPLEGAVCTQVTLQAKNSASLMALSDKVTKEARELSSVWKKGKKGEQRVRSQVDEWIDAGLIHVNQEAQVYALIIK